MQWVVVGLGNPGLEYEDTRHNTGRMMLEAFRVAEMLPEWKEDKKLNALVSKGSVSGGNGQVSLILPNTFMNKSGEAVKNFPGSIFKFQGKGKDKEITNLAVIHDDLDIPFGSYKISFNKSAGGHRGVLSVIRALKSQAFVRIRVGISPVTKSGKIRKPQGDRNVERHILGTLTPKEHAAFKRISKRIAEGIAVLVTEGREKAMSQFN
ncbi:MAG: peptidyl-tRNA hydrolase, PTH1 family [Parcubacteria group bacterium Greene0416_79]|nr:MAG: peptidyl-tRNA hydrolase, PTH1 family [Parcubacteria group bacterium Greene0416_79]